MTPITIRLTAAQREMLQRLVDRAAADWPAAVKPPTPTDILRICLHAEHARTFGEEEHQRLLDAK